VAIFMMKNFKIHIDTPVLLLYYMSILDMSRYDISSMDISIKDIIIIYRNQRKGDGNG